MTPCEQIRDDLKAYSDGELPILARLRVRRHVSQCASCREEIEAMELIRRRLRQNDASAFTPELKDKILAGIPEGVPPTDDTVPVRNKKKPLMIFGATAAAATCWFLFYPMTHRSLRDVATGTNQVAASAPMESAKMSSTVTANTKSAGGAFQMYAQDYEEKLAANATASSATEMADLGGKTENAKKSGGSGGGFGGRAGEYKGSTDKIPERVTLRRYDAAQVKPALPAVAAPSAPSDKDVARQTVLLAKRDAASIDTERQVHRDASLTVQVDSAEAKSEKVETLLKAEGGYVADSNLNTLDDGTKSATMTLKVPVDKFESFMATLSKLGEVKSKSVSGEDLTERISDETQGKKVLGEEIEATQQRLNQRQRSKLQEKQDREDLRELKTRIAIKQARLELYKKMATLSNISLTLSEKPKTPPPSPAPQSGFLHDLRESASDAGQAFMQAAKLPFVLLIWIAVYSPVWLLLLAGYRYFIVR